jgi:hypothetical protein
MNFQNKTILILAAIVFCASYLEAQNTIPTSKGSIPAQKSPTPTQKAPATTNQQPQQKTTESKNSNTQNSKFGSPVGSDRSSQQPTRSSNSNTSPDRTSNNSAQGRTIFIGRDENPKSQTETSETRLRNTTPPPNVRVVQQDNNRRNNNDELKQRWGNALNNVAMDAVSGLAKSGINSLFDATPKVKGQLGPDIEKPQSLRALLDDDDDMEGFFKNINVDDVLYPDGNPKKKIMYFLPSRYQIKYLPEDKKYSFNLFYNTSDSRSGRVIATAVLYPDIKEEDLKIGEALISRQTKDDYMLQDFKLKGLPTINFDNSLQAMYGIKKEEVVATPGKGILDPVVVSWSMDAITANNLLSYLSSDTGFGLQGNIIFRLGTSNQEQDIEMTVPLNIKLNDKNTFGKLRYIKDINSFTGYAKNLFEFPITLQKAYYMTQKGREKFRVESVDIKKSKINPSDSVDVKSLLSRRSADVFENDRIVQVWFDFETQNCDECSQNITQKLMAGTTSKFMKRIDIQTLNPIKETKASIVMLKIRSTQCDPSGKNIREAIPVIIAEDNKLIQGPELFIPINESPKYDYKIVHINSSGKTTESDWIESNDLLLVIGEATINEKVKR